MQSPVRSSPMLGTPVLSTIAQVLFEPSSKLNYARIVAELEGVLTRLKPEALVTTWDCDDLVFFDLAETRIGLGYSEFVASPIASCLTVSVGPRASDFTGDAGFDVLCSRIVERLQTRYLPLAVLWNQTGETISADLIDRLTETLPVVEDGIAAAGAAVTPRPAPVDAVLAATPPSPFSTPDRLPQKPMHLRQHAPLAANDMAPAAVQTAAELASTRAALYADDEDDAPMSTQMRLAVHCLNATLIMVWMPFGAAVMTYSILKGEDMRLSGRIMALTGTFLAIAHSPIGHSVAAAMTNT